MTARIPTRSKRQAMDWSLALLSQGIESIIDYSEDQGWGLTISEADHPRALDTIRLYRTENTRWPWRQNIRPEVLFDWGAVLWVVLLCVFFYVLQGNDTLRSAALMDGAAVSRGQWWRLFTAMCLHADLGHLAANVTLGFALLGLAMGRYGTGIALFAAYLAGAGGNVVTWLIFENHRSLGASGMVMGCLGLLGAQAIPFSLRDRPPFRDVAVGIFAGAMLFVLLGLDPRSDVLAHLGGFISGLLLGCVLDRMPQLARNGMTNLLGGILFLFFVVLTWWLAVRAH